ncbi:glycosyltransferase family 2 protein [Verrucomicrobiota bacterium]
MNESPQKRILVLMPCLNEAESVKNVIQSVKKHLPSADIIVVDDGSSDATGSVAQSAGAKILRHVSAHGVGAALETGYLYALRNNYDVVLQLDGDGQHPADKLPDLLEHLLNDSADIVIGSRYLDKADRSETAIIRKVGHKLFSGLIFLVTGLKFTDPTSGFRGLSKRALTFFAGGVFPCDYPDSDVILMAYFSGLRIREVSVIMYPRSKGASQHSGVIRPIYYGMKMMLAMLMVLLNLNLWKRWRREHALEKLNPAERN